MKRIYVFLFVAFCSFKLSAQTYEAKLSKDSLNVLKNRVVVLKSSLKIQELKITESQEEDVVEKLRLKFLEANNVVKESANNSHNFGSKTSGNSSVDLKQIERLSKKNKSDSDAAKKALDRFNKQISKVEDIRKQIQTEERKLSYLKPAISFSK